MSTKPRFPAADGVSDSNFGTVMAQVPATTGRFFELYGAFWQGGSVGADIKEMTRLRNARITDCGY
ncbi:MAG: hypothetical protein AB8B93_03130 [Pseudomonadales bacterium]